MTYIARQLFVADSNGRPITLAGDYTMNPNNIVLEPFFTDSKHCPGDWFHVSPESTGQMFVIFQKNNRDVSDPVLLQPGLVYHIDADTIKPVGVRRAGELWIVYGRGCAAPDYTRSDGRGNYRNIQGTIFPLSQIALYPGGPLSNIWCHPLSKPDSVAPMVCGISGYPASSLALAQNGYTAANWAAVHACLFNVDPATQNVYNVRRLAGAAPTAWAVVATDVNPWDRLGVIAIPSATNPDPSLAPAVSFSFLVDFFMVYSRTAEIGYSGFGTKSELV